MKCGWGEQVTGERCVVVMGASRGIDNLKDIGFYDAEFLRVL